MIRREASFCHADLLSRQAIIHIIQTVARIAGLFRKQMPIFFINPVANAVVGNGLPTCASE
jgi:hypothetical protein